MGSVYGKAYFKRPVRRSPYTNQIRTHFYDRLPWLSNIVGRIW